MSSQFATNCLFVHVNRDGVIEAEVWSSQTKISHHRKEHPHIVTISFENMENQDTLLAAKNVQVKCLNPGCQRNAIQRDVSACKHAIAVLLSRVEKCGKSKTFQEYCNFSADDGNDNIQELDGSFKYEYILAERCRDATKEYLVKWGPTKGPRGGIKRYGHGSELTWVEEAKFIKRVVHGENMAEEEQGQDSQTSAQREMQMSGVEHYKAVLNTIKFVGLDRLHAP